MSIIITSSSFAILLLSSLTFGSSWGSLIFLKIDSTLIKIVPAMEASNPMTIIKLNLFFFLSKRCKNTVTKIALEFDNNFVIKDEFLSLLIKKLEVKREHTNPYKNKKKNKPILVPSLPLSSSSGEKYRYSRLYSFVTPIPNNQIGKVK